MAAGNLGNLIVRIQADASKLKKELATGEKDVKRFAGLTAKQLKTVGVAFAAMATAATAALTKIVKSSVKYGLMLDNMAKQTGIAANEIAELFFVVEQEHGSITTLIRSLPVLAKNMSEASRNVATYKREFDALGVSVTNADGTLRNLKEVFFDIARGVGEAEDKTRALAATSTILGRGGKELFNVFKIGAEGINTLTAEFDSFGFGAQEMNKFVKDAKRFDDVWTSIKFKLQLAGVAITAQLLPVLEKLSRKILDVDWVKFGKRLAEVAEGFALIASKATKAANAVYDWIATAAQFYGRASVVGPKQAAQDFSNQPAQGTPENPMDLGEITVSSTARKGSAFLEEYNKNFDIINQHMSDFMNQLRLTIDQINQVGLNAANLLVSQMKMLSKGIGAAFTDMIINGTNFEKSMKIVFKQMAAQFISSIVEMIAQWLIFNTIGKALQAAQLAVTTGLAATYTALWSTPATLASIATGGSAVGVGVAALGSGVTSALAFNKGIQAGASAIPSGRDGIITTGNYGEGGLPAVLHPNEIVTGLDTFFEALDSAKESGQINITVNGNVDDPRELAETIAIEVDRQRRGII